MVGGGPFKLEKGQWTDDTSMALCLAESLVVRRAFDARDQMERYTRWWGEGYLSSNGRCFDIGNTVSQALRRYAHTGDPFSGPTGPYTAGNGSLMRLAPVPLFFASKPRTAIQLSAESSRTTHGATTCLDACRYFAGLLIGALQGVGKEELLSPRYTPIAHLWEQEPLCPEIDKVAAGSFKRKRQNEVCGSGYVVESLEAALWAFNRYRRQLIQRPARQNFNGGIIALTRRQSPPAGIGDHRAVVGAELQAPGNRPARPAQPVHATARAQAPVRADAAGDHQPVFSFGAAAPAGI
jgi:ADP-ribosyl-[dinitrogen reductase] hydrolase